MSEILNQDQALIGIKPNEINLSLSDKKIDIISNYSEKNIETKSDELFNNEKCYKNEQDNLLTLNSNLFKEETKTESLKIQNFSSLSLVNSDNNNTSMNTPQTDLENEEKKQNQTNFNINLKNIEVNENENADLEKVEEKNEYLQSDDSNSASSSSTLELIGNRNKTKHELATGYGFNEDQIGIFEETFQLFDKDSDGFITLIEIRTVMNALGFFPGDDIIRKGIQDIDNDNSGTVDFEEFICMMSKFRTIKNNNELDDELREIFKIFDKNQDGFIDRVELKDVLIRLGENITDDEVADMIKEADIDGDNKVSFSEFKSILYDSKAR